MSCALVSISNYIFSGQCKKKNLLNCTTLVKTKIKIMLNNNIKKYAQMKTENIKRNENSKY